MKKVLILILVAFTIFSGCGKNDNIKSDKHNDEKALGEPNTPFGDTQDIQSQAEVTTTETVTATVPVTTTAPQTTTPPTTTKQAPVTTNGKNKMNPTLQIGNTFTCMQGDKPMYTLKITGIKEVDYRDANSPIKNPTQVLAITYIYTKLAIYNSNHLFFECVDSQNITSHCYQQYQNYRGLKLGEPKELTALISLDNKTNGSIKLNLFNSFVDGYYKNIATFNVNIQ